MLWDWRCCRKPCAPAGLKVKPPRELLGTSFRKSANVFLGNFRVANDPVGSKRFHDHANCHTHTPNTRRTALSPTSVPREIEVELPAEFAATQRRGSVLIRDPKGVSRCRPYRRYNGVSGFQSMSGASIVLSPGVKVARLPQLAARDSESNRPVRARFVLIGCQ